MADVLGKGDRGKGKPPKKPPPKGARTTEQSPWDIIVPDNPEPKSKPSKEPGHRSSHKPHRTTTHKSKPHKSTTKKHTTTKSATTRKSTTTMASTGKKTTITKKATTSAEETTIPAMTTTGEILTVELFNATDAVSEAAIQHNYHGQLRALRNVPWVQLRN
ncbi:hypothetical protein COOONC_15929 [Cooperia oncophora]